MNLPHLQQDQYRHKNLGRKSLRALTNPVIIKRGGGRQTDDVLDIQTSGAGVAAAIPDPTNSWKTLEVQRQYLLNLPYSRLVEIALNLSPEVNKGLYDFLRFVNPSHVLDNESEVALRSTESFIGLLDRYYGSFKSHLDTLWAGVFLTGGMFVELVLDAGGRNPIDFVINDPMRARFLRERHPLRGTRWRLAQETLSGYKYLDDTDLVKYIGFDRLTDNPYGRPIVGPSVHASVFLLGLIQDLRRAIANMGLSRTDYELDAAELLRLIDRNPEIAGDDEATAQFITDQIDNVREVLGSLDVDSDYVHLSTVKVNYATNPMTVNLTGLNTVIDTLQRNVVNGFKGVSALVNVLDSTTETHIRTQLEYYVSALQSVQDEVADVIKQFFDIGNVVQGLESETTFRFRRQRTSDKKATAEIDALRTDTVIAKVTAGIITTSEARGEIDGFRDELEVKA